jgi:hypothetical protein
VRVEIHEKLGNGNWVTYTNPLIVVSHGCAIDKPHADILHVCRLRLINELNATNIGNVRGGGVKDAMHLDDVPTLGEAFVDFGYWYRVLHDDLRAARADGRCVASMTPEGRLELQAHLYRFHTRRLVGEMPPPDRDDW